jgi:aminopeptidase N
MAGAYKSFYLPESRPHYPPKKDFRTIHVSLDLALDFERKSIGGKCTLSLSPFGGRSRSISLDACGMVIKGVRVDRKQVDFSYDNERLHVPLPDGEGGPRTVEVEYLTVPKEGVYFVGPDKDHPEREVQAWSHNEAEFARHWFPCHDHPWDKATSELTLRVPKGFTVISNGDLVSKSEDGGTATYHWKEGLKHSTYLTSFVAGKFGEVTQEVGGVKLHYFFPESRRENVMRYFGETPRMVEVLGEVTGVKYPYGKYAQTTVDEFIFGGMENFNATTLATNYYPDAASEEDFQTSYGTPQRNAVNLVVHELAHQWFGDLVTCADWAHAWLNEGFADYFQSIYLEKTRGVDMMRWDLYLRAEEYFEEDENEYRRPIVDINYTHPDDLFDNTLYEKGAAMLHELRYLMGDEAFFRGIKDYLSTHSFANVDTHDFLRSMEESSGLSLGEFFEQSFHKAGYPEFEVGYSWDEESKLATIRVKQVQRLEGGTPVFHLPCDVVMYVGGKRLKSRVTLDAPDQAFTFALGAKPSIVEFDPEAWLLKKVKFERTLDLLLNQLSGSVDASSRAEAARALGKLRSNGAVDALKAAASKDQFFDVGATAMKALGEVGTKEALAAILEVGKPKNRRVRRGLAAALGNFKEESARKLLLDLLQNDESPYVRCEAALSLAKCWPEGAFGPLKDAMKHHVPNETLAEACLDAMGKLKDGEVDSVVRESIAYGKPTRVRIGALKAIKGRGRVTEAELPVLKAILQKDHEFRVRLFLLGDVVRYLGDRRFLDVVKEASMADADLRVRRKALETYYELSASAEVSTAVTRLTAEVEKLKEENRRLASSGA